MYVFGDVSTDNGWNPPLNVANDQNFFDLNNVTSTAGPINNLWNSAYASIDRCNTLISRVSLVSIAEDKKKQAVAEVKFIRALTYFNLVRIFGGVPIYSEEQTSLDVSFSTPRATESEVYALIEADLKEAEVILPLTPLVKGRANGNAAKGILGKVLLTQKKYADASAKLAEVVGKGVLSASYSAIFNADTPFNDEALFVINFERAAGQGSAFANDFAPNSSGAAFVPFGNPQGFCQMEPELASSYALNDIRRQLIDSFTLSNVKYYFTKKYSDTKMTIANNSAADWFVLRYADVLLMYADALNENNRTAEAYAPLNQVRKRAGLADITGLSQADLRTALQNERRLEFAFEGDRWFDLLRRGRLETVLNAFYMRNNRTSKIDAFELLFPLPFSQVTLKPTLKQNPGYN
jgi:starch-binding outer membrane protein, SusD/RagB family